MKMVNRHNLEEINNMAKGQWKMILKSILNLSDLQLSKKGQPCPMCGGKDRYSFTDKYQRGDYYCRGCGPGNGWTLIKNLTGCSFREALDLVGDYLGY
jgi:putative DNA primase/helicase